VNVFFRLGATNIFDDSKFAYSDIADAQYADSAPLCPKCGHPIGSLYWLEPRKVVLSKPIYGDFVYGLRFLVSDGFKAAYEKTELRGINAFIPVEVDRVRYMRKNTPLPPQYHALDLVYSYARVDKEKSIIKGQPLEEWQHCSLCNPFGVMSNEIRGLYVDDTHWGGEDIFHLHEMGSSIYASQRFVDFCLKNGFTNFSYTNTRDYVFPLDNYS